MLKNTIGLMLSVVFALMTKYNVDKVYIDGANPSFIKSLKLQIGEDADYDKVIARYRSEGLGRRRWYYKYENSSCQFQ
jgi:hypothetical protein